MRPGTSGVPGSVSSSPVESTTTRGLGRTVTMPAPGRRGHRDVHGPHPRPGRQQGLARDRVAPGVAHVGARRGGAVDLDRGDAAVGPLDRDHGVRPGRQLRPGHDPDGGAGHQPVDADVAGRDLAGDPEGRRRFLGRPSMSAATTAYPSMLELSNEGSDTAAVTSSASTHPAASASSRLVGASGVMADRIADW